MYKILEQESTADAEVTVFSCVRECPYDYSAQYSYERDAWICVKNETNQDGYDCSDNGQKSLQVAGGMKICVD